MGGEWLRLTWGDIATLEYGKALTSYWQTPNSARVFGTNGPIGWHSQALWKGPGIVVGRKGAHRGVYYSDEPYWVIDTAYSLQPKKPMNIRWAYYQLKTIDLDKVDDGSPIPSTTRPSFYALPVLFPSIKEQAAIATILTALDDKIALNHRMVQTLEAMGRALFKSWFVDFDPIRANAERRPTGLPRELTGLFPTQFGEDGVPVGWNYLNVNSFADVIYGAPFASERFNSRGVGLPLIRVRDLEDHNPKIFTDEYHPRAAIVSQGDIVVGMDGEFRCHIWKGPRSFLNQRLCVFRPKAGIARWFVAFGLERPLAKFEAGAVGTTVIHLGKRDIDTIELLVPGREVMKAFAKAVEPQLSKLLLCASQAQSLVALRDALLPKLISGELRVADAEKRIAVA